MQTPCCSRHFSKQMRGDAFSVSRKCRLGNINVWLAVGCNTSWQWCLISGNVSHRSGWNLRVFLGTRGRVKNGCLCTLTFIPGAGLTGIRTLIPNRNWETTNQYEIGRSGENTNWQHKALKIGRHLRKSAEMGRMIVVEISESEPLCWTDWHRHFMA